MPNLEHVDVVAPHRTQRPLPFPEIAAAEGNNNFWTPPPGLSGWPDFVKTVLIQTEHDGFFMSLPRHLTDLRIDSRNGLESIDGLPRSLTRLEMFESFLFYYPRGDEEVPYDWPPNLTELISYLGSHDHRFETLPRLLLSLTLAIENEDRAHDDEYPIEALLLPPCLQHLTLRYSIDGEFELRIRDPMPSSLISFTLEDMNHGSLSIHSSSLPMLPDTLTSFNCALQMHHWDPCNSDSDKSDEGDDDSEKEGSYEFSENDDLVDDLVEGNGDTGDIENGCDGDDGDEERRMRHLPSHLKSLELWSWKMEWSALLPSGLTMLNIHALGGDPQSLFESLPRTLTHLTLGNEMSPLQRVFHRLGQPLPPTFHPHLYTKRLTIALPPFVTLKIRGLGPISSEFIKELPPSIKVLEIDLADIEAENIALIPQNLSECHLGTLFMDDDRVMARFWPPRCMIRDCKPVSDDVRNSINQRLTALCF